MRTCVLGEDRVAQEAGEASSSELFFFSSRRRHTRCGRDWSSDVCSSDLAHLVELLAEKADRMRVTPAGKLDKTRDGRHLRVAGLVILRQRPGTAKGITFAKIGRASCRERE